MSKFRRNCILFIIMTVLPFASAAVTLVRNLDMEALERKFSGARYVKAIQVFRGRVYLATANGLFEYDREKNSWKNFHKGQTPLPSNYISALAVDRKKNHLWIATSEGVARYAPLEKEAYKKWKVYRKKDGLADNETTAIAVDDDYVWVGTRFWGVSRYDKTLNRWRSKSFTPIDGLGANRIHALIVEGKQVWAATDDGLSLYDRYTELWSNFDAKQGLSAKQVTCIASDGKGIWAGTYGGGLNYFNKDTMKFKVYRTTDGLADDTIFAVRSDGNSIWVATFGGLTRYQYGETVPWQNFTRSSHKLIDNETTALAVDGNLLWVGTDGKGITLFNKNTPQVEITGDTGYSKKGELSVFTLIKDAFPVVSYKVLHRASIFTTRKFTDSGVRLIDTGKVKGRKSVPNRKIAVIDVSKLRDNFSYDLLLEVVNTRGVKNSFTFTFTVDKTAPVLNVDELPQAVKDREIFIRGNYLELYPDTVEISVNKAPFRKVSEMDRKMRRFSHKISLNPGENVISVRIMDLGKNAVSVTKKIIYDASGPVISLSDEVKKGISSEPSFLIKGTVKEKYLNSLYLMPGKIRLTWKKEKDDTWSFARKVPLVKGTNNFQVVAVDEAGARSVQKLVLNYNTAAPSLNFDPALPQIVATRFYTVKGNWDDKDLTDIVVEPGNVKATIDKKKKTFWAKINLKNDLTRIKVTAFDAENNKKTISLMVTVDEKMGGGDGIKTTIHDARENYRLYIKYKKMYDELLARYKKLLLKYEALEKRCTGRRRRGGGGGGGPFIPAGQAVFFAPYRRANGDSMESLAKTYLKDAAGKRIIAGFNNSTSSALIKRRGSILIPTARLIRHLFSVTSRTDSWAIVDTVAEAFNTAGPGQSFYTYRKTITAWLRNRGMLTGGMPKDGILTIRGKYLLLLHPGGSFAYSRRRLRIRMVEKKALFGYIVTFHGTYIRFYRIQ